MENFIKAAEAAKSLFSKAWEHAPLVFSATSIALLFALCPSVLLTPELRDYRWVSAYVFFFLLFYLVWTFWFNGRKERLAIWYLKHLGEDEREIIRVFIYQNKSCAYFGVFHAPSASLIAKGILSHATGTIPHDNAPVVIQPYVLKYLRKHPEVIGLKKEEIGSKPLSNSSPEATFED